MTNFVEKKPFEYNFVFMHAQTFAIQDKFQWHSVQQLTEELIYIREYYIYTQLEVHYIRMLMLYITTCILSFSLAIARHFPGAFW